MQKDNQLIKEIITKKLKCVFISPHFDDAILSCGGLMLELAGKTEMTVVNVFSKANAGPHTLSARRFLKFSGNHSSAQELYSARELEDKSTLQKLGVKVINLGLEDALFRKKNSKRIFSKVLPELNHVYPTYPLHIIRGVNPNDPAFKQVKNELKMIYEENNTIYFAPYGIGNHADHQVVSSVSRDLFKKLVLYSDFPYNIRLNDYGSDIEGFRKIKLTPNQQEKNELIKMYKTQFTGLFPNGLVPAHNEIYFIRSKK